MGGLYIYIRIYLSMHLSIYLFVYLSIFTYRISFQTANHHSEFNLYRYTSHMQLSLTHATASWETSRLHCRGYMHGCADVAHESNLIATVIIKQSWNPLPLRWKLNFIQTQAACRLLASATAQPDAIIDPVNSSLEVSSPCNGSCKCTGCRP